MVSVNPQPELPLSKTLTRQQALDAAVRKELASLPEGSAGHFAVHEMADFDQTEYQKAWDQVIAGIRAEYRKNMP